MATGKSSSASRRGVIAASSIDDRGRPGRNADGAEPRSTERDPGGKPLQSSVAATPHPALTERLAYALWKQRGQPEGSPDDDWYRAEQLLRQDSAR